LEDYTEIIKHHECIQVMANLYDDWKVIAVIIGLWIVQTLLTVGPLRTELETMLVLSLVPGLDLLIETLKLLSEGDVGSIWFYIKYAVILIKDALIAYIIGKFKK